MENIVTLEEAEFTFTQDSHSNSSIECEEIKIKFMSSLGLDRDDGGYFVISTTEWSVENEDEFKNLFDRIKKIMK